MLRTVSTRTVVTAVVALAVVGSLGLLMWSWVERQRSERALAAHLEQGKAYAARVLEPLGTLPAELNESSGLAVSRTQPGVLWSHNDSGAGPVLYAVDQSGRLLATIPVANADARDWEDVASGPCPAGVAVTPDVCLYIADIGNNDRARETLTVYIVVEPMLTGEGQESLTVAARSFRFRYPDQPHDAEAFAVLPNGDATIVSKDRTGSIGFFRLSRDGIKRALASGEVLTAEDWGDTGIVPDARIGRLVTGAAVSPDAKTLAVRTYSEVFFFGAVVADQGVTRWRDLGRPCFLGNAEPQGEAIAYLDEETLLLTSERARGRPGVIHRLRC